MKASTPILVRLVIPILMIVSNACDDSPSDSGFDAAVDAKADTAGEFSDTEGRVMCEAASLCRFTVVQGSLQARRDTVANFCTQQKWPNGASAGLYDVCLVDPQGSIYRTTMGGSVILDMPGWTHSAYGGVVIPSTLTHSGTTLCNLITSSFPFNGQCPVTDAGAAGGGNDATTDTANGR